MNALTETMPFSTINQNEIPSTGILERVQSVRSNWSQETQEERQRRALFLQAELCEMLTAASQAN